MTDSFDKPRTLFQKIWEGHKIVERDDGQTLLSIDRHFVGDDLQPDVFESLDERGLAVRRPDRTFAMADHYVPTTSSDLCAVTDPERRGMIEAIARNAAVAGITYFGLGDPRQGIVHVVAPEQGLSQERAAGEYTKSASCKVHCFVPSFGPVSKTSGVSIEA